MSGLLSTYRGLKVYIYKQFHPLVY